jgi:hypothetical protein
MQTYPVLAKAAREPELQEIRKIPSQVWSGHGDVTWNIVIGSKK